MGGLFSKGWGYTPVSNMDGHYPGRNLHSSGPLDEILGNFAEQRDRAVKQQKEWQSIRETLYIELSDEDVPLEFPEECSIVTGYRALFKKLMLGLREAVEPTEEEVHGLIMSAAADIKTTFVALKAACDVVNDRDRSTREKAIAKFDIATDCVKSLSSLITLLDDIKSEIDYSIEVEKVSEQVLVQLMRFSVLFFAKIPLPNIDYSLNAAWQGFLARALGLELSELGEFELDVERTLAHAMTVVQVKAVKGVQADDDIPSPTPLSPSHRFFPKGANRPAPEDDEKEDDETADLRPLSALGRSNS